MRYLKQFESNNNDEILDYIKSCFIDFIDNEEVYIDTSNDNIELEFNEPELDIQIDESDNMSVFIEHAEEVLEFYKNIDVCMKKFKLVYTECVIEIETFSSKYSSTKTVILKFDI